MVVSKPILDRPMHFAEGAGVKSLAAQSREVAQWLPQRNSGSYLAIVDYMKFLIGKFGSRTPYPASPAASELSLLPEIDSATILEDLGIFSLDLPPATPADQTIDLLPRQNAFWITYRSVFLQDLARSGIPHATLAWDLPVSHPWNQTMLAFLVKHWRWAMARGAFSDYATNDKYCSEAICRAVMERWIRGRVDEDEKYRRRKLKSQRRATIFGYRQDALEQFRELDNKNLLPTALSLFPSADCCSDTEDDGPGRTRAVGLAWRSREFSEFLHLLDELSFQQQKASHGARWAARRLDIRRSPAKRILSHGKAPRNLLSNCYCPVWKDVFGESHKHLLTQKPASSALNLLISTIRTSLHI